jgi:hypothetical protein
MTLDQDTFIMDEGSSPEMEARPTDGSRPLFDGDSI